MTTTQQFKILEILETTLGREKAKEFTERIEEVIDAKIQSESKVLATKSDLKDLSDGLDKKFDKFDNRLWAAFITIVIMILGLYGTIIFRH